MESLGDSVALGEAPYADNRAHSTIIAEEPEVPSNCPQEYLNMLDSESRTYDKGRWTWKQIGDRPNHYLDCEAMQVCGAIMLKLIGLESVKESE